MFLPKNNCIDFGLIAIIHNFHDSLCICTLQYCNLNMEVESQVY